MDAAKILAEAQSDKDLIIKDRRELHKHPGTGFDIKFAVDYVTDKLTEMGYEPKLCGKAGVIATADGKNPGKVFLIRGDMDALPIEEESGEPFCSEIPGKMHACGHDNHAAMLLEAARILKRHEDEIQGTVKLMFQPAEEIFLGADDMIKAGVLENPDVDYAMMIHVATALPFPAGTILASDAGVSMAACDFFDITVQGKGAHGSSPSLGIDPILSACNIIQAIQQIHSRELSLDDGAVLTVGYFNSGAVNNVIPDTASFGGSLRTFDENTRSMIKERVTQIATSVGKAYRTPVTVEWSHDCPTLKNDAELAECIPVYLKEMLGQYGCITMSELSAMMPPGQKMSKGTGSEDFAFVSQKVPTLMLMICAGSPENGYIYSQHHPKVRFDEDCLPYGAASYAYGAMRFLEEHQD